GSARLNNPRLKLTDNATNQVGSVFTTAPIDVTAFATRFTFQVTPPSSGLAPADGLTFTIQRSGPTALGTGGGGLGYAGITPSVAIKFDFFSNGTEPTVSTGRYTNGQQPIGQGAINLLPAGIDFRNGHVFQVDMNYDGTTLEVAIRDLQTQQTATQTYTIDIPGIVGDNSAHVGFTGATGGLTALQEILTWTYAALAPASPVPPSGLGAVPVSAVSVQLTWTANSTNHLGYHLDRATDPEFTQQLVQQTLPAQPATFIDRAVGLFPGGTYYYRLRAFNSAGVSDYSNIAEVAIPVAPPRPTDQRVDDVTADSISLSWQDNAGHDADGYRILRAINFGLFSQVATLPPTSRTPPSRYEWTDTGLPPGAFVQYHIIAFNVSGNNDFAGVSATTLTVPPGDVFALASSGVVALTWSAPAGAVRYHVYRGTSPGRQEATLLAADLNAPRYIDTEVVPGTTYYYTVTAVNANADRDPPLPAQSEPSDEVSALAIDGLAAPARITAIAPRNRTTALVNLSWVVPFGARSHNVYRATAPNERGELLVSGVEEGHFTDTTVIFGRTYYYRVAAVDDAGEGPLSAQVAVQPLLQVRINFTSPDGDAAAGYVNDTGDAFGPRGGGLIFGWDRASPERGVDRDAAHSPDEPRDSFHELQGTGFAGDVWRLNLPNGDYRVRVVLGDPLDGASAYAVLVSNGGNGGIKIAGTATALQPWIIRTVTLRITRGQLVLRNVSANEPGKVAAIEITGLPPTLSAFGPDRGNVGTTVTIRGTNFIGTTGVYFGERAAEFRIVSAKVLRAVVPVGALTGRITVATLGGEAVSTAVFTPAPRIDTVVPTTGAVGSLVTVTGANFTGTKAVTLRGRKADFTVVSDTQLTFFVPAKAKSGRIIVTTAAGSATSAVDFTVA
ncbi:MAG: IPT/TIG domain-containing protein, partial [Gemmataceae bacterium]|nr:IPT/TIG domain-containing protein [Gemmataceae bacterium]